MKPKKYTIKEFAGIVTSIDQTEIPNKNAVDCSNVDISVHGELSSIKGMEKQVDAGLGGVVSAIWQLNGFNFSLYNGTLGKL